MGQLAVGLGGAALSAGFGFSPALGFTAGTFLGGLLFPPDPIRIEGPRREDLRVSSSTHGRPIPEGFGVIRLPGNMIWSSQIREVQTTTEIGGKGGLGGPSQEQISYTYFVDCSFAFAQGPAEAILRVFADGKPIYDVRDPSTTGAVLTATTKPGLTLRTYLGTEDQLPCPTIQAAEGADDTPAYRGTVYLTLESFELTDFGNRIPQITAEIAFKAVSTDSGIKSTDIDNPLLGRSGLGVDYIRNIVYTFDAGNDPPNTGLRAFSMLDMSEMWQRTSDDMGLTVNSIDANDRLKVGRHSGRIYFGHMSNSMEIDIVDPDALVKVGSVGTLGGSLDFNHSVFNDNPDEPDIAGFSWFEECMCLAPPGAVGGQSKKIFLVGHGAVTDGPYVLDVSDPANTRGIVWQNGGLPSAASIRAVAEPPVIGTAVLWEVHQGVGGNADVLLFKWTIDYSARMFWVAPNTFNFTGVVWSLAATFTSNTWGNDGGVSAVQGPIYDETDGNLIFYKTRTSSAQVWKWNKTTGAIQWNTQVTSRYGSIGILGFATRVRNGRIGFTTGTSDAYFIMDTISGKVVEDGASMGSKIPGGWWCLRSYFWDDTSQCFISQAQNSSVNNAPEALERFCVGRKLGLGEPLSDVVTLLSGDNVNGAGLAAADFDVTQLVNDTVRGYAVTRRMPIRQALEPLLAAYDFDATEADDKIKFIKRGGASVATITQADIVAAAELVRETRTQEIELPERLELGYLDPGLDYQENIAQAKRPRAPVPTMYSLDDQTLDLAIVFTATEAKELAERLLYTAWSQRQKLTFALGDDFIRLVPADVITLTLDSGSVFNLRIVKADTGINHTQSYEAVVQESTLQVASNAAADTSAGFIEDDLPTSVNTRLCLIDAPYLRDIDATNRESIELKYAMAGYQAGWQSGVLWDSADGVSFSPLARSTAPKTYGIVTNKLPTGMENLTDAATTLTVAMVEGELASVGQADFIANGQVAIIGSPLTQNWEYVAFRDAVQAADGRYDVSHLLRGRRGTDAPEITDSHAVGELFIVADRAAIDRVLLALGDLNVVRYYRGVGRNDFLENADTIALASKARPLMPHRPHLLTAAADGAGNIDFTWARSARLNFELTNSSGWNNGPLGEDSEAYDLVIMDGPGGADVRTIAVTAEAAEYAKADIAADLAVLNATAQIDVGTASTFIQASGSFVTDGFVAGQTIETANFTDAANNGVFTVQSVAALTLTIEETTLVAETGTGDETLDAIREDDITFRVYQVSAQVGRGFASAETTIAL